MNITLTADEKVIAAARAYAIAHNTTLNQMVREYLERVTAQPDSAATAEEFARLAREEAGCSDPGFRFNREAAHQREPGR
jgi:hypothetical protein